MADPLGCGRGGKPAGSLGWWCRFSARRWPDHRLWCMTLGRSRSRTTDGLQRATQRLENSQGVEPKQRRGDYPRNDQVEGWRIRISRGSVGVEAARVGKTPKQNAHSDDETHHPQCDSHGETPGSCRKNSRWTLFAYRFVTVADPLYQAAANGQAIVWLTRCRGTRGRRWGLHLPDRGQAATLTARHGGGDRGQPKIGCQGTRGRGWGRRLWPGKLATSCEPAVIPRSPPSLSAHFPSATQSPSASRRYPSELSSRFGHSPPEIRGRPRNPLQTSRGSPFGNPRQYISDRVRLTSVCRASPRFPIACVPPAYASAPAPTGHRSDLSVLVVQVVTQRPRGLRRVLSLQVEHHLLPQILVAFAKSDQSFYGFLSRKRASALAKI